MREFLVFQSLWAMQDHRGQNALPVEAQLERIAAAGFDGFTDHFWMPAPVQRLSAAAKALGLQIEGQLFPRTRDDLARALDVIAPHGCHHLTLQADVRAHTLGEAVSLVESWLRLAEQVDFPVLLETHRYRITNDLPFTLDLLRELPDLKLLADLSHYVAGREIPVPLAADDQQQLHAILARSWGFHGRVASCEQVQVGLQFAQHRLYVEMFLDLWQHGIQDWLARPASAGTSLSFTCELGPPPYAITDADGLELTDRWDESLQLKDWIRQVWAQCTTATN
ncbi:sugar phosphate isomerase/epimerase family protein [Pseudomonas ovata]|uniref:sugar phosphate isomerase/epimerase family protein n=1 Tax=Pseudomonas ovata TaxID=1839709 RepID=UPI000D6872DC|nr:xylose isomerase [Pseudomonas ovata]